MEELPPAEQVLDIGCGPVSFLWKTGLQPIGLDISHAYTLTFNRQGKAAITASSTDLPFADRIFDGVWSIGLLHHLSDDMACKTVEEMLRVCRRGGYVAIIDAVMPKSAWANPLAYLLRRTDRGITSSPATDLKRRWFDLALFRHTELSEMRHGCHSDRNRVGPWLAKTHADRCLRCRIRRTVQDEWLGWPTHELVLVVDANQVVREDEMQLPLRLFC